MEPIESSYCCSSSKWVLKWVFQGRQLVLSCPNRKPLPLHFIDRLVEAFLLCNRKFWASADHLLLEDFSQPAFRLSDVKRLSPGVGSSCCSARLCWDCTEMFIASEYQNCLAYTGIIMITTSSVSCLRSLRTFNTTGNQGKDLQQSQCPKDRKGVYQGALLR